MKVKKILSSHNECSNLLRAENTLHAKPSELTKHRWVESLLGLVQAGQVLSASAE